MESFFTYFSKKTDLSLSSTYHFDLKNVVLILFKLTSIAHHPYHISTVKQVIPFPSNPPTKITTRESGTIHIR